MKVVVLHNQPADDALSDELDVLHQRDAVIEALEELGHDAEPVPCSLDLGHVERRLREAQPDVVFNLVESLAGTDRLMPLATLLLDALHIPYTGAPTSAVVLTGNKLMTKRRLIELQLPTPAWYELPTEAIAETDVTPVTRSGQIRSGGQADSAVDPKGPLTSSGPRIPSPLAVKGRAIIKAVWEHASLDLEDGAVVTYTDLADLERQMRARLRTTGRPPFAEDFIEGREFNLTLLADEPHPRLLRDAHHATTTPIESRGVEVLPPAEIDFSRFPTNKPRIVGYRAKWDEQSFEYQNTPRVFDFPPTDQRLLKELRELALLCWEVFGLRGYARIDFRVDSAGQPWVLEVNANPCLAPDAGFAAAVQQAGYRLSTAVHRILESALHGPH